MTSSAIITKNKEISAEQFLKSLTSRAPTGNPIYCEFPESPENVSWWAWKGFKLTKERIPEIGQFQPLNRYVTVSAFNSRYRRKDQFASLQAVMIDDIGPKIHPENIQLEPTFKVESSPKNFQYWYILETPITDFTTANDLVASVVALVKKISLNKRDTGCAGLTRYGRFPGSINNKYDQENPWVVRATGNPNRTFTIDELKQGLDLPDAPAINGGGQIVPGDEVDTLIAWSDPVLRLIDAADGVINDRGTIIDIRCPWIDEHSHDPESGTAILVQDGGGIGFKCHHGHCQDRTLKDVNAEFGKNGYQGFVLHRGFPISKADLAKGKRPYPVKKRLTHIGPGNETNGSTPTSTLQGTHTSEGLETLIDLERYLADLFSKGLRDFEIEAKVPNIAEEWDLDPFTVRRMLDAFKRDLDTNQERENLREELNAAIAASKLTFSLADYLPPDIYEALAHLQQTLNYEPEVVLAAFLTTFSGIQATGSSIDIAQAGTNFVQPLTLYSAMIAASGQKKSPLFQNVISLPLAPIAREIKTEYQALLLLHNTNSENTKPKKPTLYISAATSEGLLRRIENQPDKGILFFRDELTATFKSLNAYKPKGGDDEEVLLELYDGSSFETARSDEERDISIDRSHLSIYGGIQDEVFKKMLAKGDANGKFARFWFTHQPERPSFLPKLNERNKAKSQYIQATLTRYYRWARDLTAPLYTMSDDTYENCFQPIYNLYERKKEEEQPFLKAIWGKCAGRVARVAALLHQLNCCYSELHDLEIPQVYFELAQQLEDILIAKTRQLYFNAQETSTGVWMTKVKWALARLQAKGELSIRYLSRCSYKLVNPKNRISTAEAKQIFAQLVELGQAEFSGEDVISVKK